MSKLGQETSQDIVDALERAAHSAVFGSREARSGRFNGAFTEEKRIATMILREAQSAFQAWANWEAINTQFATPLAGDAILHLELGAIGTVRSALGANAVLHAYTLTDDYSLKAKDDRLTLCRFAHLLEDSATVELLASEQWSGDLGHSKFFVSKAAIENHKRIDKLRSLLVANWSRSHASDPSFEHLRSTLRPVRNRLAHAVASDSLDGPTIDQIRQFLRLTLDLATDMAILFTGSAVSAQSFEEVSRKQAQKFWEYAFKSPIEIYATDMRNRSKSLID